MREIRVLLRGGLGNQLFQYAAGLHLSEIFEFPLILRHDLLPKKPDVFLGSGRWPEQISTFSHSGTLMSSKNQPFEKTNLSSKWRTLRYRLLGSDPLFFSRLGYLTDPVEYGIGFPELVADLPKNKDIILDGYFQTLFFAIPQRDIIRKEILGQCLDSHIETGDAIGIHIRLGDNLWQKPGLLQHYKDYYLAAVRKAGTLHGKGPKFAVFSDQEDLASTIMMEIECDWTIVQTSPSNPIEALRLMSACNGLVASSSTLAWWAGFLQQDWSRVYVKHPWVHANESSFIPEQWNRISGNF